MRAARLAEGWLVLAVAVGAGPALARAQEPGTPEVGEEPARAPAAEEPEPGERGPTAMDPEADQEARQHFLVGRSYYEQARYEDAAREFAEAYALTHYPALLINLGMAHERALQYDEAIEAYDRYLAETGDEAEWRRAAELRAARLREIRDRRQSEARAAEPRTDAEDEGLSSRQVWGLGVLGGGAAAGVAALVTGLLAHRLHDDLEGACDADGVCPAGRADDIDRGRALAVTSTALTAVAVAAGGVGLTLVLLRAGADEEAPSERPQAVLRVILDPVRPGARLEVRF